MDKFEMLLEELKMTNRMPHREITYAELIKMMEKVEQDYEKHEEDCDMDKLEYDDAIR